MSRLVSIRLNDYLFQEMKAKSHLLHLSQTDYIRKAVEYMNDKTERLERKKRLRRGSLRVREESMRINAEFSRIDHDPEA